MLLWILLTHYNDFHKSGCDCGRIGDTVERNERCGKHPHGIAVNHND